MIRRILGGFSGSGVVDNDDDDAGGDGSCSDVASAAGSRPLLGVVIIIV